MTGFTAQELAELRAKAEAATPGPWWACIGDDQPVPYYRGLVAWHSSDPGATVCTGEDGDKAGGLYVTDHAANARFSAALNPATALRLIQSAELVSELVERLKLARTALVAQGTSPTARGIADIDATLAKAGGA